MNESWSYGDRILFDHTGSNYILREGEIMTMVVILLVIAIGAVDCYCYSLAPFPERRKFPYWIPFVGGPLALYRLGRSKRS